MVISGGGAPSGQVCSPGGVCQGDRLRNTLPECGLTCRVLTVTADCLSSGLQMSDRQTDRDRDTSLLIH